MNPNANSYDDFADDFDTAEQEWIDSAGQPVDEVDEEPDYVALFDPTIEHYGVDGDGGHHHPDAVALLPRGTYRPTFEDRCRAVRVTSYAAQRERNARFEHLRRLLCEQPSPVSTPVHERTPMDELRGQVNAALTAESRSTARCTCCPWHPSPVFKHEEPLRNKDDQVHIYLRMGWALRECPDCIRNFYADRKAAEVGERVKGQCQATLHRWSLEEPDSSTVKTDEEREAEAAYDLGPVSAADLYEVDVDKPRLRPVDAILASTRTLDEDMVDEPVFSRRATAAITTNLKTSWVTYTSSQAKARVTLNTTSGRIKIRYGKLDIYEEHLRGFSQQQLLDRRDGLVRWCQLWLKRRGIEPNVAEAVTQKANDPVAATRRLRDRLSIDGIECNVRFIR